MNNDLISRKVLMELLREKYPLGFNNDDVAFELCYAPAVDAEPVVRCNQCKHYETDTGFCQYHGGGMDWVDYCSRAEKMDEEG